MYKTVRHGENSLQYKILAQQEEGVPGVKRRRSPKVFILKLIAILTLLVVGIIASAFLVPLLLANDFITVTGTFQKFSVSTLRRSHTGNHVVVIAKKPYGWNTPQPSLSPKQYNFSQTPPDAEKSSPPITNEPPAVSPTPTAPTAATTHTAPSLPDIPTLHPHPLPNDPTTTTTTAPRPLTTMPRPDRNWGWSNTPPTTTAPPTEPQSFQKDAKGEVVSSKVESVWFNPIKKWRFRASDGFGDNGTPENWFLYLVGGLLVVVVVIGVILGKTVCRGRASSEKETEQSKEDKKRLLKPSVSSDHDEE